MLGTTNWREPVSGRWLLRAARLKLSSPLTSGSLSIKNTGRLAWIMASYRVLSEKYSMSRGWGATFL